MNLESDFSTIGVETKKLCLDLANALGKMDIGQTVAVMVSPSGAKALRGNPIIVVERLGSSDWDVELIPGILAEKFPGVGIFPFFEWSPPSADSFGRRLTGFHIMRHETESSGLAHLVERAIETISLLHPKTLEARTLFLIEDPKCLQPDLGEALLEVKQSNQGEIDFVSQKVRKELASIGRDSTSGIDLPDLSVAGAIWIKYLFAHDLLVLATWDHTGLPRSVFLSRKRNAADSDHRNSDIYRWNGQVFVPFENQGFAEFLSRDFDPEEPEEDPPYPGGPNYCTHNDLQAFFPEVLLALDSLLPAQEEEDD